MYGRTFQMGQQGLDVAAFGGLQHGQGGVEAGDFGFDKAQVGDLRLGFLGELADVVGFIVEGEGCHDEGE